MHEGHTKLIKHEHNFIVTRINYQSYQNTETAGHGVEESINVITLHACNQDLRSR